MYHITLLPSLPYYPIPYYTYNFQGGLGNTDGLHEFLLDVEEALERLPNKVR
jgi:hypothetical protein